MPYPNNPLGQNDPHSFVPPAPQQLSEKQTDYSDEEQTSSEAEKDVREEDFEKFNLDKIDKLIEEKDPEAKEDK